MASNEDARTVREAKLDELHEKLTGAVESLVSGDGWRHALAFAARFRSRSFNSTMLIWVQHEAAFEVGRVPEPFPYPGCRVPAMAGPLAAGDEGPARLHDLRARDGQVRVVQSCRSELLASPGTTREAQGQRGRALADGRGAPSLRVGRLPDRRRTAADVAVAAVE